MVEVGIYLNRPWPEKVFPKKIDTLKLTCKEKVDARVPHWYPPYVELCHPLSAITDCHMFDLRIIPVLFLAIRITRTLFASDNVM